MEIWKSFIEGHYEASNLGRVRSIDKIVLFNGTPSIRKGTILKPTKNSKGYLTVVICVDGTRRTMYLHQIIAQVFIDNPESKPTVNHKDGDIFNNKVSNLEWMTFEENYNHAKENGFISKGNKKLTEEEVSKIKLLIYKGYSNPELSKLFNIDKATIRNIRIGKSWTQVKMAVESLI